MAYCVVAFPYARGEGLGRAMNDNAGMTDFCLATIIVGLATLLLAFFSHLLILLLPLLIFLATACMAKVVMKRIPGLTGDIYWRDLRTDRGECPIFLSPAPGEGAAS